MDKTTISDCPFCASSVVLEQTSPQALAARCSECRTIGPQSRVGSAYAQTTIHGGGDYSLDAHRVQAHPASRLHAWWLVTPEEIDNEQENATHHRRRNVR